MSRSVLFFAKIFIPVALAIWIANQPGQVSIIWSAWRVDTSFGFIVAFFVLALFVGFFVLGLFKQIINIPRQVDDFRKSHRRGRGYDALTRTLTALGQGNEKEALRLANRARKLLGSDSVSTSLAAQAALIAGDNNQATVFFQELVDDPKTAFLGWRGLMQQARKSHNFKEALYYGEKARKLHANAPLLLRELFEIQSEAGKEEEALFTLKKLRYVNAISVEKYQSLQADLHHSLTHIALGKGDHVEALKHASQAFEAQPAKGLSLYADLLLQNRHKSRAKTLVEKNWHLAASSALAKLYLTMCDVKTPMDEAKALEKLSKIDRGNATSMLVCAEGFINTRIWGQARQILKRFRDMHEITPKFCKLMARLEQEEKNNLQKAHEWLNKIPDLPGDKVLIDED